MSEFRIYCDESNHLIKGVDFMVLGAVYCPEEKIKEINLRIGEIKSKNGIPKLRESKWVKVSPSKKQLYLDLIDYFFDNTDLHYRGIVIDKKMLNHKAYNQTHDDWYYKMYFELLSKILDPNIIYSIYLDTKDTRGRHKTKKLKEILSNSFLDFEETIIKRIQEVRSHEIGILQLTDILNGVLQAVNRPNDIKSIAKKELIERVRDRSNYSLLSSTLAKEGKLNIFYWHKSEFHNEC
ncbi:MAG: DUF3800 domain-containing protein [Candidatus Paceibacterota bacterium]|jgi:hypothetical protein